MRAVSLVALVCVLGACAEPAPPAPMPSADRVRLDGVEDGPVTGTIAGESFTAAQARFRVVRREGRERVDLWLADHAIERCGLALAREDTRVWLRFSGVTELETGTFEALGGEDDDFDVHYERPNEGPGFTSVHRAVARLEIRQVIDERIDGTLSVCFADDAQSCVSGTFEATPCLSRVDGRALREPPGLSDDALEAIGAGTR